MTFNDSLTRLRRFLRDPDGDIHTDAQLKRYWDHAQLEVAQKTGILERAESYRYPSRFTWTYTHDWEAEFLDGDALQVLTVWPAQDEVVSYPWEPNYLAATDPPADEGDRFTQPWEAVHVTVADPVPVLLHALHNKTHFVAYDEEEVIPLTDHEAFHVDGYRRTRIGTPEFFYALDETRRLAALYPQPQIVYDELEVGDVFDDDGGIVHWLEGLTEMSDYGIVTESIETANNLFMVYEAIPRTDLNPEDEHDWPEFLIHYLECATLERAYGADTDGFMPTLRDYWRHRKEIGIEAMRRFKSGRSKDRIAVMGVGRQNVRVPQPRLPDHFPRMG